MLHNIQTLPTDALQDNWIIDAEFDQHEDARETWIDCVSDRRMSSGEITLISF